MCGRYSLFTNDDNREILRILQEVSERRPNAAVKTGKSFHQHSAYSETGTGNHPAGCSRMGISQLCPQGGHHQRPFRNGGGKEALPGKSVFRRCIVPSTGFFEWSQDKAHQKYRFYLPESDILYMAGLYSVYNQEERFVILTTEGNASIRDIHHRMPVVISPDHLRIGWENRMWLYKFFPVLFPCWSGNRPDDSLILPMKTCAKSFILLTEHTFCLRVVLPWNGSFCTAI